MALIPKKKAPPQPAALTAEVIDPVEVAPAEEEELVEVQLAGELGTNKILQVNGVATAIPCGVVLRVTPEVAKRYAECSLI